MATRTWRGLVVVLCAALGSFSFAAAGGEVLASRQPRLALTFFPWSADAKAQLASQIILGQDGKPANERAANVARATRLAQESILRKPANAAALSALAMTKAVGDPARATALFRLSERMSRRDTAAQLALIEADVERGDVPAVLRHYDRTMQVKPQMANLLIPILAAASKDAPIRVEIGRTLRTRPFWWGEYVTELARSGTSPAALSDAAFAVQAKLEVPGEAAAVSAILYRLATLNAWGDMRRVFARYCSDPVCRTQPVNGGFERRSQLMPLDWVLPDDPAASAIEPDPAGGGQVLTLRGGGSAAVRQLMFLAPQGHVLSLRIGGTPAAEDAPALDLACTDGRSLLKARLHGAKQWRTTVRVPAGCPAQWLTLTPYADRLDADAATFVDDIRVVAANG